MSDVEKLTHDNQERRRWAEQVDAREAAAKKRASADLVAERQRTERNKASRVCYMIGGACAGITGTFIAAGLLFNATRSWIGAIGAAAISIISILCAVELDGDV